MLQQTGGNSSQLVDQELTHEFLRCENEKPKKPTKFIASKYLRSSIKAL